MTAREFSIEIVRKLTLAGYTAFWAGGCVRDLLLGKEPNDFDVATSATPAQVRELFGKRRTLAVGESFGVIIVLGPKSAGQIEVATFRTEGDYLDGRRPESVDFCSPEEDSKRRDFTINGMFYDPVAEQVHDFVGGEKDLKRKLVRAIGVPQDRMEEDKLRLLRAVRFTALLGFELESATATAVKNMSSQIVIVSAERIAQELRKMLVHPQRASAMRLCEQLELLSAILPEVVDETIHVSLESWEQSLQILEELDYASFEMGMAVLLCDIKIVSADKDRDEVSHSVRGICNRLKLSNLEKETIMWLVEHLGKLKDFPEWTLAEQKKMVVKPHFEQLFQLERVRARVHEESDQPYKFIKNFRSQRTAEELCPPEILNGRTLIELGYLPGPKFQTWLKAVRDAQLNEEISTQEQAVELIKKL